jgi:integrase
VDPGDFSKGIQAGPFLTIDPNGSANASVAVGDSDGDGRPEVAVAYERFLVPPQGLLSIFTVDPKTLALQLKQTESLTALSREEITRLIEAAPNLLYRTMLLILYGTGLRRAEVVYLKVSDIDSQRMYLV